MAKNEIKTVGVAMMIMIILAVAQANSQIEPNNAADKLLCAGKCAVECAHAQVYITCLGACLIRCRSIGSDVAFDCLHGCDLTKAVDINNDARRLAPYVLDACLQTCWDKN
ncbi:hypothetical protein VNO77_24991 [Canavalia gladiata]|uniref:Uncharacterized protein n=1 Tax=Canavalia gladiata TaxID=3824 RepID=A0AAN9L8P7_CANGL